MGLPRILAVLAAVTALMTGCSHTPQKSASAPGPSSPAKAVPPAKPACGDPAAIPLRDKLAQLLMVGVRNGDDAKAVVTTYHVGVPTLVNAEAPQRNRLLDAAYHFAQYVFLSEVNVGNFLSAGMVEYYGELSHLMASNLKGVRQHLGSFFDRMSAFPQFRLRERMLLVEGHSEQRFVERLRPSRNWFPYDLHVVTYEGKANRNSRLNLLVRRYQAEGYDVFVQGDADGRDKSSICRSLSDKHGIATDRVFLFTRDFEHSLGPMLTAAGFGRLLDLPMEQLAPISAALTRGESIADVFAQWAAGRDYSKHKVRLAESVAEVLHGSDPVSAQPVLLGTEISDFLAFANR